jgi:putative transposase
MDDARDQRHAEADTLMGSLRVVRVLDRIIAERGVPQRIRSDNGPEFTSRAYPAINSAEIGMGGF